MRMLSRIDRLEQRSSDVQVWICRRDDDGTTMYRRIGGGRWLTAIEAGVDTAITVKTISGISYDDL